jgi:hypothetical protein
MVDLSSSAVLTIVALLAVAVILGFARALFKGVR